MLQNQQLPLTATLMRAECRWLALLLDSVDTDWRFLLVLLEHMSHTCQRSSQRHASSADNQ
jgi:hypothetical protein